MGMHSFKYSTFNIKENTPSKFYDQLNEEFNFTFDPCPPNPSFDGLEITWKAESVYVNPPYGRSIKLWLKKALEEINKKSCKRCVFLLPSYTDVRWFHDFVLPFSYEIRFIKGRLKFGNHKDTAPFASMLVIFQNSSEEG